MDFVQRWLSPLGAPPQPFSPPRWVGVIPRFDTFDRELKLTVFQHLDGHRKQAGVRECLNLHYWREKSETTHSLLVGSWGKRTQVRPPRDVDILFALPVSVHHRFDQRAGNKQSALLQEVKEVLSRTYPGTDIRGDGQVVVVPFATFGIEVAPGFLLDNGRYWTCDTHDGGRYTSVDPVAEAADIDRADAETGGKARRLIRMLKRWQAFCNVPMESFWLEILAIVFLRQWRSRGSDKGTIFFDWMVRDFFAFLLLFENGWVRLPNMTEQHQIGSEWVSRARTAYGRAFEACQFEDDNYVYLAGEEWQKIFGADIPMGTT